MNILKSYHAISFTLGICFAVLCSVSCQNKSSTEDNAAASKDGRQVRLQQKDTTVLSVAFVPTTGTFPFFYAERTGIYRELGLPVRFERFAAQADCDRAMETGKVSGGSTDIMRLSYLLTKGKVFRAVMSIEDDWKIFAAKQLRADKLDKIKGKLVATTRYAACNYTLEQGLRSAKLTYDDVYHPQINSLATRRQMLLGNQVDATVLPAPWSDLLQAKGYKALYTSEKGGVEAGILAFGRQALTNGFRRKQIALLIEGYNKAVEALKTPDRAVCDSLWTELYGVSDEELADIKIKPYRKAQAVRLHNVKAASDWLPTKGVKTDKINRNEVVTTAFIKE